MIRLVPDKSPNDRNIRRAVQSLPESVVFSPHDPRKPGAQLGALHGKDRENIKLAKSAPAHLPGGKIREK